MIMALDAVASLVRPSASRDRADERAGDPLHGAGINAEALGDSTDTFTGALTLVQGGLNMLFKLGGYARPPKLFALVLGAPKPGADSFCDHRPLKLGEHAKHLKHGLPARRRGVQALLMQEQINVQGMQLGQEGNKILQAAAEPIDAPSHDHVELALSGIAQKAIELRPLVPALSAADAVILVDTDDLAAHAAGNLAQLPLLVGRGLV